MKYKIITNNLFDGHNFHKRSLEITINGNKVEKIQPYHETENNDKAQVIDARGDTVLPGLIDTHVHVTMNPDDVGRWDDWIKEERKEILILKGMANALSLINSGVTTVLECGACSDTGFILREAINRGIVKGPRMLISGNPITITGGHCHYMGIEADNEDEIRKAVRHLNKQEVDFIKFMPTGGSLTPQSNRRGVQYSLSEVEVLVEEAKRCQKKVVAHALGTEGIVNSVKAGVDSIEHCAWLAPEDGYLFIEAVAEEIADKGIFVTPTLPSAFRYTARMAQAGFEERINNYKTMHSLGVKFLAGTDAGVPEVGFEDLAYSVQLLHEEIGLSIEEAIETATSNAAKAIGKEEELGTVEVGKLADLIIVKGDLSSDVNCLKQVKYVIKDGERVVEKGRDAYENQLH
jgi:imidazolonepropionase-like amidohydrolase